MIVKLCMNHLKNLRIDLAFFKPCVTAYFSFILVKELFPWNLVGYVLDTGLFSEPSFFFLDTLPLFVKGLICLCHGSLFAFS